MICSRTFTVPVSVATALRYPKKALISDTMARSLGTCVTVESHCLNDNFLCRLLRKKLWHLFFNRFNFGKASVQTPLRRKTYPVASKSHTPSTFSGQDTAKRE
ncbi:unnamed protein product [Chrysodeixis includens]|uniref:Uncharacterized protein n=1 Tax=Chrysodeixis includens TaxID=689277 RepID=A0A9N8Q1B2_CHRIL|nr:unnamed protein product [Chrysodeixis includens]